MTNTNRNPEENTNIQAYDQIPHSGSNHLPESIRDQHPTGEYDSTSMQDVAASTTAGGEQYLSVPDSPATMPDTLQEQWSIPAVIPPKEHRDNKLEKRNWKIKAGSTAVAALALVGAYGLGKNSDTNDTNTMPTTNPTLESSGETNDSLSELAKPLVEQKDNKSVEATSNEPSSEQIDSEAFGIYGLDLGLNYITAIRPNGEEIKIPRLRDGSPNEQASIALNLMACYLTTGNQECLDEFSQVPDIRQHLIDWRERDVIPMFAASPGNIDAQVAIVDSPEDPVNFISYTNETGHHVVEMESGTLFLGRAVHGFEGDSNEWQHTDFRTKWGLEETITEMKFVFTPTNSGGLTVVGMRDAYILTP